MTRRFLAVGALACACGLLVGCAAWLGPSIDFASSTAEGQPPLAVEFTAVCDTSVASYSWTFGDGETSNGPSPIHIYRAAGTYTVGLTAELVDGTVVHEAKDDLITVRPALRKAALQYIYWIEAGSGAIWRGPSNGGRREEVLQERSFGITTLDVVGGWVYWADSSRDAIRRARTDGSDQETLIRGQRYVTDIRVVPETDSIFWVREPDYYAYDDDASGGVYMASLSDLEPLCIVSYAPGADRFARHVDVDVVGEHIYWTLTHYSTNKDLDRQDAIRVTSTSGFAPTTFFSSGGLIGAIELDAIPGFAVEHVYWFNHGFPTLYRIDMDGSHKHAVVQGNELTGWFTVDRMGGKIYFTSLDGIERCDLDGSNRELLHREDAMMGIALPR